MSILITGASGLIGRHLVAALDSAGEVLAPSRQSVDLASPDFASGLPSRADIVVHLAQSAHYQEFPERAADIFAVNVASTASLLDWSRRAGVSRFILASSGGADQDARANRPAYYLASKRSSELLAQSYRDQFTVIVLRFFFVYGRGQRKTMLIPRLIDRVRTGQAITLAGEQGFRLNPVHVDDAVRAVVRAIRTDRTDLFDIAGPEVLSLRAIGDVIGRKVGRAPQYVVDARAEPQDLVGDITAMAAALAAPERSFESGLDDLM